MNLCEECGAVLKDYVLIEFMGKLRRFVPRICDSCGEKKIYLPKPVHRKSSPLVVANLPYKDPE
jgi:hypothetical protein